MAASDKDFKVVLGNPEWYIYRDKPSYKLFSAGVYAATAVAGLAFYGLFVPWLAGLFPPTMAFLKYLTWTVAVGVPALTVASAPKRFFRAFKARIWGWYRSIFKPSKREQVRLNIEMLREKVKLLAEIARQMGELHRKWDDLQDKYVDQLESHKKNIARLTSYIETNESATDKKVQLNVVKAKKDLLLAYSKAEGVHGFVNDIREKVDSLSTRLMQAEEARDREHHEMELLQGKYELLIAQSELGEEAEVTRKKLSTLSAGGIGSEYLAEVSEIGLIGETEQKLALLDITLNSITVSPSDLGYGDLNTQLEMSAARSQDYMEH